MNVDHLMFAAAVMMLAAAIAIGVAKRLNLGSIVALLVVGMGLGPHSPLPLFTGHIDQLQAVGEIGVMLLLFVVGLDVQPKSLWSMRRLVFGLGSAQYLLTGAAIMALLLWVSGLVWQSALVVGLGLAMSSDAVSFPILQERAEEASPQGRATMAVDIFQSFMVIPVLALIPILGVGRAGNGYIPTAGKALVVCAAVAAVYVLGRYLLPRALVLTARNLGSGAFALIVLAGVLGAGWLMDKVGISMALGAFMIGVLLSTTVFAQQIKAAATPAKQVLLGLFFIAIGMAIDLKEVLALGGSLLFYLPVLLSIKFGILFVLALGFRLGVRAAFLTGLLLMPFDEIAYVIFASAKTNGLLNARSYTIGLTGITLSFVVSPLLINLGNKLSARFERRPKPDPAFAATTLSMRDHVVIVGYSYVGRAICVMLEWAQIPYICFETDLARVAEARRWKHNVHYGDASDPTMMRVLGLARARSVIVTTTIYDSTKRVIGNLRQFYPSVAVMTAVQYLAQREELRHMGATRVMALAPEGTLSFGRSILDSLGVSEGQAVAIISSLEANDYAVLRGVGAVEPDAGADGPRADARPARFQN
jgi:glutathione-regulated potassium-efflux system ancillary protein KefC